MTRPKLLLADDSVTIRKVVELTFADEGIDVSTVADGDAAMSKFVEVQPDIVLVDVGLPGTNGYQICEMIKADESTTHIPVLLLVGSFEPFDQDAAEKSGADGFLTKPFHSIRDLVNRVHELLGTRQAPLADDVIDFETTQSDNDTADTEDITDLYERSFAETMPIENFETVSAFRTEDAFPEEIMSGEDGNSTLGSESSEDNIDASHHAVDEWLDDELIETTRASDAVDEAAQDTGAIRAAAEYEQAPAAAVDAEPIKEFDWSPAAIVTADEMPTADASHKAASSPDAIGGVLTPLDEPSAGNSQVAELSPDMIEIIVQRVMERLSDRAVREVAQEAVPRIAEKLMREALEEERNK